jgi:ADP-ribosyl-[dinitrogen reductase] hydrolase
LSTDFQTIRDWGAAAVVNLIEDHEMAALSVEDTARYLPAGVIYLRLPIPDFGIPNAAWEVNWKAVRPVLLNLLHGSQNVLVHCKGGLGRAGTIGARLLVEMGMSPDAAILAVREARSGAIETAEQESYVKTLTSEAV